MQMPVFRLLALIGLLGATTLIGACGADIDPPKAACGNTTLANTKMSCPPGFVPPAS
ncbi:MULTISPECIES: hypothetical protein [Paraburkholderia]|uniref:Lipoprotein n=1 Tax=Paraburkholderia megapolitana TaxID=420953 RepID=A0A1I3DKE8_9BURK|nr:MULTISPECIES: hypothetical protein [Paraburkholderia]MCX4161578.1 hypothetical protein [Paraburkholderia megapolitana]MDN7157074.1 hypothetical protein [Paraburkholderia sp. CHISQ3]MDQ6494119.1 hypothetical protein [Paraburkholderia megapolitana]SFH87143.1 hypothetical protein SAMN05192543_101372 [Paraburkholderia megapolitana]